MMLEQSNCCHPVGAAVSISANAEVPPELLQCSEEIEFPPLSQNSNDSDMIVTNDLDANATEMETAESNDDNGTPTSEDRTAGTETLTLACPDTHTATTGEPSCLILS